MKARDVVRDLTIHKIALHTKTHFVQMPKLRGFALKGYKSSRCLSVVGEKDVAHFKRPVFPYSLGNGNLLLHYSVELNLEELNVFHIQ